MYNQNKRTMATRSNIGIYDSKINEGRAIYCHWDGYPEHNGAILLEHYNTKEKVLELMELGNLSVLGQNIGSKVDFNNFRNDYENGEIQCIAYGRDRGEANVGAKHFRASETYGYVGSFFDEVYEYLFIDGVWHIARGKTELKITDFVVLTKAMCTDFVVLTKAMCK